MADRHPPTAEVDPQRFLDLSGSLLVVAGFDGDIRWLSPSFPRMLGFAPAELLGSPFTDFVHPDDMTAVMEQWRRLLRGGEVVGFEFRSRTVGSYRSLLWSAVGVVEEELIYAVAKDVTDLREAESLFESAFANARLAMLVASVDPASLGRLTAVNAAGCRFTGYSKEELLARDFQSLMHPDDLDSVLGEGGRLLAGEIESFELEKRCLHAEGHVVWGRMHISLIRDPAGEPLYAAAQIQDITDRKRIEQEVASAERRFEQIFADAPIGMALLDAGGRYLQVNRALCELFGRSAEELVTMRFQELTHPEDVDHDEGIRARMLRGDIKVAHREKRFRRADGSWLDAELSVSRVTGGEEAAHFIVQVQDITGRKQVERVVRGSRERLQRIIDGMPSSVFVKDLQGRYELVNTTLAASIGLRPEDMVGMVDRDFFAPEALERFRRIEAEARESKDPVTVEETVELDGRQRAYLTHVFALRDDEGIATAVAGTGTDITDRARADEERRRLEARAQEAQRLETVGRLAGGVAHDFNNLLSVILNSAALAAEAVPEGSEARADLEQIRAAAERAADLTHQLVQFSRQEMVEPQVLDPNAVVVRAQRLLERTLGEDVELRTEIGEDMPAIEIDPGQLERILLNLAVNARDAMPGGGTLEIVTGSTEIDGEPYARLAVRDSGHGMTPETAARAFEPFFTTKTSGEGTGLGLATVYGIVNQAGGTIALESRVNQGTDVTLRFPSAGTAPPERAAPAELRTRGRGQTVLVVEDESSVRGLAARLLREGGYEVDEAAGGRQALDTLEAADRSVDLLLTDVVMPGMSGRELADRLTASRPETIVLFMSGYTDDVVVRHGAARVGMSFLPKPFSRDTLLRAVSEALSRQRA